MTTTIPTSNDELTIVKLLAANQPVTFIATATSLPEQTVRSIGGRYGYPDKDKLGWAVDELTRAQDIQAHAAIPPSEHADTAARAARAKRSLEAVPRVAAKPQVIASLQHQEHAMPENTNAHVTFTTGNTDRLASLLERAAASDYKRTKALGTRIADLVDDLYYRLDGEEAERKERHKIEAQRRAVLDELAAAERALAEARQKARALTGKAPKPTAAKPAARTVAGDHDPKVVRAWAASNGVACPAKGRVPRTVVDAWHNAQRRSA